MTIEAVFTLIARGVHSFMAQIITGTELYLPSLRGEFTACAADDGKPYMLYLPSLRGEFTALFCRK